MNEKVNRIKALCLILAPSDIDATESHFAAIEKSRQNGKHDLAQEILAIINE